MGNVYSRGFRVNHLPFLLQNKVDVANMGEFRFTTLLYHCGFQIEETHPTSPLISAYIELIENHEKEEELKTSIEQIYKLLKLHQSDAPLTELTDQLLAAEDLNAGRFFTCLTFLVGLCDKCEKTGNAEQFDRVVSWAEGNFSPIVNARGGWEGLVRFYEQGPDRRNDDPWPSFSTICGYAAGAVGVLGLGAILAHKS